MKQYEAVASPTSPFPKRPSGWSRSCCCVSRLPLAASSRSCGGLRRAVGHAAGPAYLGRVRPAGPRDSRPLLRPGHHCRQQRQGRLGRGVPPDVPALPARLHRRREPQNGLYLAEQATARAADGSSHVVAGWSAAFAAEAHALVGEERKARLLLERADFHLSKARADDPMFGVLAGNSWAALSVLASFA